MRLLLGKRKVVKGPTLSRRRVSGRLARGLFLIASACLSLVVLIGICIAIFVMRLDAGPLKIDGMSKRIEDALADRLNGRFVIGLGDSAISRRGTHLAFEAEGFDLRTASGHRILTAPKADVTINPLALLVGEIEPNSLEVSGLDIRLVLQGDGSLVVEAGGATNPPIALPDLFAWGDAGPGPADSQPPAADASPTQASARPEELHRIGKALRTWMDAIVGPDGMAAKIERLSISRGRLTIDDRVSGHTIRFDDLSFDFDRSGAAARGALAATGVNGRFEIDVSTTPGPSDTRIVNLETRGVTRDELMLASGVRAPPFESDLPLATRLTFVLEGNGAFRAASGHASIGKGYFRLNDPDHEPLLVDGGSADARWDFEANQLVIDAIRLNATAFACTLSGAIAPPAAGAGEWTGQLRQTGTCGVGIERPGETDMPFTAVTIAARYAPSSRIIDLNSLKLEGAGVDFSMSGSFDISDAPHVHVDASARDMPVRKVLRIWPSFLATDVRGWMLDNLLAGSLREGTLAVDMDAAALQAAADHRPVPDNATKIDIALADATLVFLKGSPPLTGLQATGRVTGQTVVVNGSKAAIELGAGRRLGLTDIVFSSPDTATKPSPATLAARVTGSLDSVADLLQREPFRKSGGLPLDPTIIKGVIDGRIGVDFKLDAQPERFSPTVQANATITNFSVEKIIGKERLENGTLTFALDHGSWKANGTGKLLGTIATLDLRKTETDTADATIAFQLDDAGRARLGLESSAAISGPMGVRIAGPLTVGEPLRAQVDIDLTKTALEGLVPGLGKPAGKAAKASFALSQQDKSTTLDKFVLEAGSLSARGTIDLDASGGFEAAKLSQVRLSPGDDMKMDISRAGDGLKVSVRGNNIDARPFLKDIFGQGPASDTAQSRAGRASKDVEIDLKSPIVTGYNKQALSGVDLRLTRRDGRLRHFQLTSSLGRDLFTASMARDTGGGSRLILNTKDGGGLLSFLDLYRRMEGGWLAGTLTFDDQALRGSVTVSNFVLRDEPALRRLVADGQPRGEETARAAQIDPAAVQFNKLQLQFTKTGTRFDLKDAVIWGSQIGISLSGAVDFVRDQANLAGTFVPAYGLNNAFAKIPLVGLLLGGGTNEGLFAVNFRITGSPSAPSISINPLSAIAPGFCARFSAHSTAPAPPAINHSIRRPRSRSRPARSPQATDVRRSPHVQCDARFI